MKCLIPILMMLAVESVMGTVHLTNAQRFEGQKLVDCELWVDPDSGVLVDGEATPAQEIDMRGAILCPGFIDIQINGAFGIDFSQAPERVDEAAARLPCFGVTAFAPTVVTSPKERYPQILKDLAPSQQPHHANILGCHLEGPYLNPDRKGAHDANCICTEGSLGDLSGVCIMTLAPEQPGGLSRVQELTSQGILVSAGHSSASYEECRAAREAGVKLVTHLFNAMTPIHHRAPGLPTAALTDDALHYSVIADGHHLHEATLRLAYRAHPKGMILVSDAMPALGLPDGTYRLGELEVTVQDERAVLKGTETLAGSVVPLNRAVQILAAATGDRAHALNAASSEPARLLGLFPQKGSLDAGADADFVVLDKDLNLLETWIAGQKVYEL